MKKTGTSNKLQPSLPKHELNHDEIYEDTWEDKEHEWLPYLKNDSLSTAFFFARYSKSKEEITDFGMKNNLTLPSLANKFVNSLRDENDDPLYTFNDEYVRNFVRKT